MNVAIKTCEVCGKPLGDVYRQKRYCPECKRLVVNDQNNVAKKLRKHKARILSDINAHKATGQPVKLLAEWCREAAECNLDYGTYRTLVEIKGETFEELKAQNQNRSAPCHAHGHHTRSIRDG